MLLFYLRHGDPVYDPDSLTPLGRRQAEALAMRLSLYGLDEIYASTSQRARLTAMPTCEVLKKEPILVDWAHETHAWEYMADEYEDGSRQWCFLRPEIRKLFVSREVQALGEEWYTHPAFQGTGYKQGIMNARRDTDAFLASLGYVHDRETCTYRSMAFNDRRIALFAHHGFGMSFLSSLLDIPYPSLSTHFNMGHTGMTVIEFQEEPGECVPQVLQLANDGHLLHAGLPTAYNNELRF